MIRFNSFVLSLMVFTSLVGCSTSRFLKKNPANFSFEHATEYTELLPVNSFSIDELYDYCLSLPWENDNNIIAILNCSRELLGRKHLPQKQRSNALSLYNNSLYTLVKADKTNRLNTDKIKLKYHNEIEFTLIEDLIALDERLSPQIFGELGVPIVTFRENSQKGQDKYLPLEGVTKDATIVLDNMPTFKDNTFHLHLSIQQNNNITKLPLNHNLYSKRHSPAGAYLYLLNKANIDDYNWLGFFSSSQAEKRRGVFSINGISKHKTPIIMLHGLNSDPLIWRHLTMAIYNSPSLADKYQVWHVYYPSGLPPFYNAALTRNNLRSLLNETGISSLAEQAIIIGHSMGGVIAKLLSTEAKYELWDTAFNQRPENLIAPENMPLQNIFIYKPVFNQSTVFFLDTPFKGSEVASSAIGYIGAFLISLPFDFKQLMKRFIDRVGPEILTEKMRPFIIDHGPSSVQVLRPGHPLMETLYHLPVVGDSYAIIGSNGELNCNTQQSCSLITDGVVNFNSANYLHANDRIIVSSTHNSFKNEQAIQYVLNKLLTLNFSNE